VVRLRDDAYEIEDFGSTNGTRVNGDPVNGTRRLYDGDRLSFADVEIEFRLGPAGSTPLRRSTEPEPEASRRDENRLRSLRHELHEAPGFSIWALMMAVAGSVVGTILTGITGTGQWGTLAGAAVGPVVSTVFSTKRTGEKGRVRGAAIVLLSVAALLITWAGFSVTDAAAGTAVVPGADHRSNTFPGGNAGGSAADPTPTHRGNPATPSTPATDPSSVAVVQLDPVTCGSVAVGSAATCAGVTITYHGDDRLRITGVEVVGPHSGDFRPGRDCVGEWLSPGQSCEMIVQFRPTAAGDRTATLVVHQNLPRPDRGTRAPLTGTAIIGTGPDPGTCRAGFVWREVVPSDHVCVTPETRSQVIEDNRLADSRRNPAGGTYGPDTCLDGFVWRDAVAGDHVCVTGDTRSQAAADNAAAAGRRVG
jgi:hypothetical protein